MTGKEMRTRDRMDAGAANRLLDLLGHTRRVADGEAMPLLAHWMHFGGVEAYDERGPDGHRRRGDFLPALPQLPRRMWAGSRVTFHGDLSAGAQLERTSTICDVTEKEGRSGPLAFATVRHAVHDGGRLLVEEEQTLVFREAPDGPATRPAAREAAVPGAWHRTVTPDAVMLFRYSALTWNSHRIHYDADYVRDVEGYPGLVIHGPLTATLLLDLAARHDGRRVQGFEFRALAPLFLGDTVRLDGDASGRLAASREGVASMEAKVAFA